MKRIVFSTLLLLIISISQAQELIPLWPKGKMPNSKGLVLKDSIANDRLYQVGEPRVYKFLASEENNTGAAVLIIPGGGYLRLSADYTNISAVNYYQSKGINAFVVCHRLPTSPDLITPEIAPLQDIQRAMRIIQSNAEAWNIDPNRIGVFGTSAGGHAASTLGTHEEDVSAIGDDLDNFSFKPAYMILISPVISFTGNYIHKGSRDRLVGAGASKQKLNAYSNQMRVTKNTPPAMMIHADNDTSVPSMNSVVFYQALQNAGVSSSLLIFPKGKHRLSVRSNPGSAAMWPELSLMWLKEMKFIK